MSLNLKPLFLILSLLLCVALPVAAEAQEASTVTVEGRVLDPWGNPVEGATVGAVWLNEEAPEALAIPAVQEFFGALLFDMAQGVTSRETGADGSFELEVPEGATLGLTVLSKGFAPLRIYPAAFDGRATLRLERGVASRIRVLSEEAHEPLAGARVIARQGEPGIPEPDGKAAGLVHRQEAVTDEKGWATLPGLARSSYQLRVEVPGRVLVDELTLAAGATLRAFMPMATTLSGQVLDESGAPVEGATLLAGALLQTADDPNPRGVARSLGWRATAMRVVRDELQADAEGFFRFDGLPPGATARVTTRHPGFSGLVEELDLAGPGEETAITLILPPTFPLSASFVNAQGRGVEGVRVQARACREEGWPEPPNWRKFRELPEEEQAAFHLLNEVEDPVREPVHATSDESGQVLLELRGRRCQDLSWSAEGFARGTRQVPLEEGELPSEIETATLSRTHSLSGRVFDFEDEPVPGVEIWIVEQRGENSEGEGKDAPEEEKPRWLERNRAATTDEGGRFTIEGVESGGYLPKLDPGPAEWRHDPLSVVEAGERDIEIGVYGAGVLEGRVVDATTREPLGGAWAVVRERSSGGLMGAFFGGGEESSVEHRREVGEDGRFRVGIPPGSYQVQIRKAGFLPFSVNAEARIDESTVLDELLLERGATLQGTVLGPDDLPLAGARVGEADDAPFSMDALERMAPFGEKGPPGLASTTTNLDGRFRLTGLPSGDLRVRAHHPACAPLDETVPALSPGELREGIVLRTHLGGTIEGAYTDGNGDPIVGTFVIAASPQDIAGARTATTDEQGRFRIEKLPSGQHFLIGMPPDMAGGDIPLPVTVEIRPGEVAPVSLSSGGGLPVQGTVTLRGEPLAGARVSLVSPSQILPDMAAERPTAADGSFRLTVSSPGDYLASVEAEEPELSLVREVTVPPGGGTLPAIGLAAPATLEIKVKGLSGEPVEGAQVTLWYGETLAELPTWARESLERSRSTEGEGELSFGGLAPGSYRVEARAEGHGSALATAVIREGSERGSAELVLPGVRSVSGSVVTEQDRPVRQAMLVVLEESGEAPSVDEPRATDQAGLFELKEVPDRPMLLAVGAQGLGVALATLEPGDEDPRIVMRPAGGADVLVTGASGERVEVLLSLETPEGIVLPPGTLAGVQILLGGNSLPDREGWVRLRALEPGRYTLRALREGREVGSASLNVVAHEIIEDRLRVR